MMRAHLLVVGLLLAVVAMAAAQTRPKLSETFEMAGIVQNKYNGSYYWGEGTVFSHPHTSSPPHLLTSSPLTSTTGLFAADPAAKKGVERIMFGGYTHLNVLELARYDLVRVPPVSLPSALPHHESSAVMVTLSTTTTAILHNSTSCTPWRT
jgi:hypothetical protein